jgi:nicotinate-nucleotide pyrophosphorylase (carboxylating)
MNRLQYSNIVTAALTEDIGCGDVTTDGILKDETGCAEIVAHEKGVLAGMPVAAEVFHQIDPSLSFTCLYRDGDSFNPGDVLARVEGSAASILKGERVALNFLQRMSGIATHTRAAVEEVAGTKARITDTRKTTPGLRGLEKYAVRTGGGQNHRFNLSDLVLIKDNHIRAAGSISQAVSRVRKSAGFPLKIEVEVTTLKQVKEALNCEVDIIMLDNMPTAEMYAAVNLVAGRALTEASGGITMDRLHEVASTGVDLISMGLLIHGSRALDLSLNLI